MKLCSHLLILPSRLRYAHFCGRKGFALAPPPKNNNNVSDDLFWTADGKFYSVEEVFEDFVIAHCVKTSTIRTDYVPVVLPWNLVGVFKFQGVDEDTHVRIQKRNICGKALNCANVLTTWKNEWIMSKEDL